VDNDKGRAMMAVVRIGEEEEQHGINSRDWEQNKKGKRKDQLSPGRMII